MTADKADDIRKKFLSIGIDKRYDTMDFSGLSVDIQGWGQDHSIFLQIIKEYRPSLVIEVGTWKGASLLKMFEAAKQFDLQTTFICVDTWLGSHVDLWRDPNYRESLLLQHGFPTMFRQFIFNVIQYGAVEHVFPLPMTSTAAAATISSMGLQADAIYIDASHDEHDVMADVVRFYDLLAPGGVIFGDDYSINWPGVVTAVNRFAFQNAFLLRTHQEKWWIEKSSTT